MSLLLESSIPARGFTSLYVGVIDMHWRLIGAHEPHVRLHQSNLAPQSLQFEHGVNCAVQGLSTGPGIMSRSPSGFNLSNDQLAKLVIVY
jgi:hypothetical protein